MRKAERAVENDPYWSFRTMFCPAFDRMVRAQNTPAEAQARFEYHAILNAAREVYHNNLLLMSTQ